MPMPDKWGGEPQFHTVQFFHHAVAEFVSDRLARSGTSWEAAVHAPELELTRADFEQVERQLLGAGYRFDFSARISLEEEPEKYKPEQADDESVEFERDEHGRALVGTGDNVFRVADNLRGTARIVSTIEVVMEMLTDGVPENTVAIIDDSGGTLTAPILEGFSAVVCKGGTIRSHLGILTREYRIPCLMAAELSGIRDGDEVEVEVSADAVSPYKTEGNVRARVWKLN